jgi:glycosyltransferase involved in cell wall biosynthesis
MKVLMVSKASTVAVHRGRLRELVKLGVDLTVIVPPRWGNHPLETTEADECELRMLPCWFTPYNHFHFYPARIGPIDADLVYLEEEPWSLVTHQFMRLCVKSNKPAIFATWQNVCKKYPFPFNLFERYTFSHAMAGVAGTDEIKETLRTKGFEKPVSVIPHGLDPDMFFKRDVTPLRRRLGLENAFIIGFVGRLSVIKALPDLIRALSLLPAPFVLVIIGEGDCRAELERLAVSLGVASRIRWIPWISSLEVPDYMNLLDVLVLPSRTMPKAKEQFGRVLIEAMACEKPTVGSTSGGIPHVIGDAGLIFPEGEVDALAAQLRSLQQNAELRARLGSKGRARVLANYTNKKIAEKHLNLFREVLARCSPVADNRLTGLRS